MDKWLRVARAVYLLTDMLFWGIHQTLQIQDTSGKESHEAHIHTELGSHCRLGKDAHQATSCRMVHTRTNEHSEISKQHCMTARVLCCQLSCGVSCVSLDMPAERSCEPPEQHLQLLTGNMSHSSIQHQKYYINKKLYKCYKGTRMCTECVGDSPV